MYATLRECVTKQLATGIPRQGLCWLGKQCGYAWAVEGCGLVHLF
jgi:hypothetical protein